jgi:3-hydroxyisobutyrate dehydrogenase
MTLRCAKPRALDDSHVVAMGSRQQELSMPDRIGWVGLGDIGMPMAANVARRGFLLTVCDLRPEPVRELVRLGATAARSAAETAAGCDVMFVCLPGRVASEAVAAEVFSAATRPTVYTELSTLSPATVRGLASRAALAGVEFLDVPVSGGHQARFDGTLTLMAGGEARAIERIRPVLDAIGSKLFVLGPVGAGSAAKIANNLVAMTSLVTALEALLIGIRAGLEV